MTTTAGCGTGAGRATGVDCKVCRCLLQSGEASGYIECYLRCIKEKGRDKVSDRHKQEYPRKFFICASGP